MGRREEVGRGCRGVGRRRTGEKRERTNLWKKKEGNEVCRGGVRPGMKGRKEGNSGNGTLEGRGRGGI